MFTNMFCSKTFLQMYRICHQNTRIINSAINHTQCNSIRRFISHETDEVMKPILYIDNISPPVRSCLMLIDALNLNIELKNVDLLKSENRNEDFLKLNPAHTVPTLQDDKLILTDSHAILIYLCEKFQTTQNFYPKNDKILSIQIINKLFFECSILFRRDSDLMSEIFRQRKSPENLMEYQEKIYEVYSMMEKFLEKNSYIACDHLTVADFSMVTTLSTLNIIFPVMKKLGTGYETPISNWPLLSDWFSRMQALPSYQAANIPGLENLKRVLKNVANFDIKN